MSRAAAVTRKRKFIGDDVWVVWRRRSRTSDPTFSVHASEESCRQVLHTVLSDYILEIAALHTPNQVDINDLDIEEMLIRSVQSDGGVKYSIDPGCSLEDMEAAAVQIRDWIADEDDQLFWGYHKKSVVA